MSNAAVVLDTREVVLAAEWLGQAARLSQQIIAREIMAASLRTVERVKREMPIDTGRARASWGSLAGVFEPGDGIWDVEDGGLTITQGSNVEYVPELNEGHSRQAPAGFIDAAAEDLFRSALEALEDALEATFA